MYERELRAEVSQGDILDQVPIPYVSLGSGAEQPSTRIVLARVMLLTHDCEYDKPNNDYVIVAAIRPLAEVATGSQGNVRQRKTRNTFYLEALPMKVEESFVDFRRIDRIGKSVIKPLADSGRRIASITDDARAALQWQLAVFFGHGR